MQSGFVLFARPNTLSLLDIFKFKLRATYKKHFLAADVCLKKNITQNETVYYELITYFST